MRKQSFGVGVERTFPLHSPKIERIEVIQIGDVNRAKLYYLRKKVGKKARVRAKQYGGPVFSTDAPAADEEADELEEGDEPAEDIEPAAEESSSPSRGRARARQPSQSSSPVTSSQTPPTMSRGDEPAAEEDGEKAS